jgi:drug/metabolite transporter (DMT)-like permease
VWEARHGGGGRIPRIDQPALDAGRTPTLLLTMGSIPFWLVLVAVARPPAPSPDQVVQTGLVALFSGVIATSIFLRARSRATNAYELAATDATQSLEVVFSLLGETLLLAGPWPGPLGAAGMALAVTGLVLYVCRQV